MTNDGEMGGMALRGRQWQQQEPRRDDDNEDKVTLHCMRARASACNGAEEITEADPILLA